jgi:hypothetical protein
MLSRSVRLAGNRHSYGYIAGAGAQTGWLPAGNARDSSKVLPGGGADRGRRSKRKSAGHFRPYALPGKAWEPYADRSSMRRIFTCPTSWGQGGRPQPGRMPRDDGFAGTGNGRARTGAVCARVGLRPGTAGNGPRIRPVKNVRRRRFQAGDRVTGPEGEAGSRGGPEAARR